MRGGGREGEKSCWAVRLVDGPSEWRGALDGVMGLRVNGLEIC